MISLSCLVSMTMQLISPVLAATISVDDLPIPTKLDGDVLYPGEVNAITGVLRGVIHEDNGTPWDDGGAGSTDDTITLPNLEATGTICDGTGNCVGDSQWEDVVDGGINFQGGTLGNVGIGLDEATEPPLAKLHIKKTLTDIPLYVTTGLYNTFVQPLTGYEFAIGAGADYWGFDVGTDFHIGNDGDMEVFNIKSNGNVGIGTANPNEKLEVMGEAYGDTILRLNNTLHTWDIEAGQTGYSSQALSFYYDGIQKIRIMPDGNSFINTGNIGIGTTGPTQKLHIASGNARIDGGHVLLGATGEQDLYGDGGTTFYFDSNNSDYSRFALRDKEDVHYGSMYGSTEGVNFGLLDGDGNWSYQAEKDVATRFLINNDEKVTILANGNVGIGTNSPDDLLHLYRSGDAKQIIQSTSGNDSILDLMETGDTYGFRIMSDGGDNKFYIKYILNGVVKEALSINRDNGNVGIGITSPTEKLEVDGNIEATGDICTSGGVCLSGVGAGVVDGSGTASYISKWTTGTTQGDSIIYDDGTNIGIGTTIPEANLSITGGGTASVDTRLIVGGSGNGDAVGARGTAIAIQIPGSTSQEDGALIAALTRGGTVISQSADLAFSTALSGILSEQVRITKDGNVGIGTTDPTQKLHIDGNTRIDGGHVLLGAAGLQDLYGDDASALYFDSNHSTATDFILRDKENTRYGSVYGDVDGGNFGLLDGDHNWSYKAERDVATSFLINNSEKMRILANGNVGIGTSNPTEKLEVDGNIFSSSGSYGSTDSGVTHIIKPAGAALDSSSSVATGAFKITLPQTWTYNAMMKMNVEIYDYAADESFTVKLGGFSYVYGTSWGNTYAQIIAGKTDRDFTVRFGHDGTNLAIWIGELDSTWSYPKVVVTDFMTSHSGENFDYWDDGWDITLDTSFTGDTINRVESNNLVSSWIASGDDLYNINSGNVGIGTTTPASKLDVVGGIKFGTDADICAVAKAGTTRYNSVSNELELCNGTEWAAVGGDGGGTTGVPAGNISAFSMEVCPGDWLEANGGEVSRASYATLFGRISTIYGVGDGSTTFNLPNYRGQFLRGWDKGEGVDPDAATRTDRGDGTIGDNVGTKQEGEIQSHTHLTRLDNNTSGWGAQDNNDLDSGYVSPTSATGGNETRPTNINVLYCIKTIDGGDGGAISLDTTLPVCSGGETIKFNASSSSWGCTEAIIYDEAVGEDIMDSAIHTFSASDSTSGAAINAVKKLNVNSPYWYTNTVNGTKWIKVDFGRERYVDKFGVAGNITVNTYNPKGNWYLQASNDDTNWITVHEAEKELWTTSASIYPPPSTININNPGSYRYYRIIGNNWNNRSAIINSWAMYEGILPDPIPIYSRVGDDIMNPFEVSISASDSTSGASINAISKVNASNYWYTNAINGTKWIKVDFGEGKYVDAFGVAGHVTANTYNPKGNWYLQASNDDTNWITVHEAEKELWTTSASIYPPPSTININNPGSYRYYRIIGNNWNNRSAIINSWAMYEGLEPSPIPTYDRVGDDIMNPFEVTMSASDTTNGSPENVVNKVNISSLWGSNTAAQTTKWVKVDFGEEKYVDAFGVTGHTTAASYKPSGIWYLQASNDDTNWETVWEGPNTLWTNGTAYYPAPTTINVSYPGSYRYYRIISHHWKNSQYAIMQSWAMYQGAKPDPIPTYSRVGDDIMDPALHTFTASHTTTGSPERVAIKANVSYRWGSNSAAEPTKWVKVDFGRERYVDQFAVAGHSTANSYKPSGNWSLEASNNDTDWATVWEGPNTLWTTGTAYYPAPTTINITSPGSYRYYRVIADAWTNSQYGIMNTWSMYAGDQDVPEDYYGLPNCGDGEIMSYNISNTAWECSANGGGSLPTCTDGQVLAYNGTSSAWECGDGASAGTPTITYYTEGCGSLCDVQQNMGQHDFCSLSGFYQGLSGDDCNVYQDVNDDWILHIDRANAGDAQTCRASCMDFSAGSSSGSGDSIFINCTNEESDGDGTGDVAGCVEATTLGISPYPVGTDNYIQISCTINSGTSRVTGRSAKFEGGVWKKYDGSNWINCDDGSLIIMDLNGSGGSSALPTCTDGQILAYNGTSSAWECGDGAGGGWESITNDCGALNYGVDCEASCTVGKKLTGGGCVATRMLENYPLDNDTWICSNGLDGANVTAYVICDN